MKPTPALACLFARLHVPAGILIVLLQRTPVVRWLAGAGEHVLASPLGQVLRASLTAATLGALHSRAGATTYIQNPAGAITGTVGTPLQVSFTYNGTPSEPQHWQISGSLPPGLAFTPALNGNIVQARTPVISGTPTQAGNFSVGVLGVGLAGQASSPVQIQFQITGGTTVTAPAITTQPQSQTVTAGANVTFSVVASGTAPLTYQWRRDGANLAGQTNAQLALTNVQSVNAGAYTVVVTNSAGSATSAAANLVVNAVSNPVTIAAHPVDQTIATGSTVVFTASATGATSFQWRRNGVAVAGATSATLVLTGATAAQAGSYTLVASSGANSVTSNAATLTVGAATNVGRLSNLSILTDIAAGGDFTMGYVVSGASVAAPKPLLIRAVGPTLGLPPPAGFGLPGVITDPRLELFAGAAKSGENDDWGGGSTIVNTMASLGAFPLSPGTSKDAAVVANVTSPDNSVKVSGVGSASGLVISEIYDATTGVAFGPTSPRLKNVSVLKTIGAGASLSAGFVIAGDTARTVLVRAVGPTLGAVPPAGFGLSGTMENPELRLFRGSTEIAINDDWGGDAQLTAVGNSVGAFPMAAAGSRDAILLITLPRGDYSARVSGIGGGGLAIVEVYEVP